MFEKDLSYKKKERKKTANIFYSLLSVWLDDFKNRHFGYRISRSKKMVYQFMFSKKKDTKERE